MSFAIYFVSDRLALVLMSPRLIGLTKEYHMMGKG